jgi:hypothetical protein
MARNKEDASQLLVSERVDQTYRHFALLRPKSPISGAEFDQLLEKLRDNGEMLKIFQPYRIAVLPLTSNRAVAAERTQATR